MFIFAEARPSGGEGGERWLQRCEQFFLLLRAGERPAGELLLPSFMTFGLSLVCDECVEARN